MSWVKKSLRELAIDLASGGRPKGGAVENGIFSIGAEHLDGAGGFNLSNGKYIPIDFYNSIGKGKIKTFDILLVKDGATTGKVSFVSEDFPLEDAAINEHVFRIELNQTIVYPKYCFYYLISSGGQKNIMSDFRGATVGGISKSILDKIQIPLPPLETQKRIADILDAADALRQKDQVLIKKYDELAQAIFINMFGDNKKLVKLNQITTKITDGVHAKPNYQESGIPFLSVKNVTNKFLDFNNSKFISVDDHENYVRRCNPELEDILYTKVGATYGRAAIINVKKEFSIYVSLALIKPDRDKVYPYYLNFVLNTDFVKKQADRRVKGAGVPDLHLVEIKDFDIPLPTYSEQLAFSNIIENLRSNIGKTKDQIEFSENLFQTLLQKAFNGELVA